MQATVGSVTQRLSPRQLLFQQTLTEQEQTDLIGVDDGSSTILSRDNLHNRQTVLSGKLEVTRVVSRNT